MQAAFRYTRIRMAQGAKTGYRPSASASLPSGQRLDAGIAARQSASRKNIKKAKRPFQNYFKTEFRVSPVLKSPLVHRDGKLSSYDAARMATDPNATWDTPWGTPQGGVSWRNKRQDVLERPEPQFGDSPVDATIKALLEIRFQWDKEDDLVATSVVPDSMFSMTEHCSPYATSSSGRHKSEEEYVMIGSTKVAMRRPRSRGRKKEETKSKWDFHGTESIPVSALDASKGPLLSSVSDSLLTVRWKAERRSSPQVAQLIALRQTIKAASLVGLPSRSVYLLLKCMASSEMEDPSLDVSIGIAIAEHYHHYEWTECLEILRALRRVSIVRGLPALESSEEGGLRELYSDPELASAMFGEYVAEVSPTLIEKVWSRLPEHSSRLLHYGYYLDWFDLLGLAVEVAGYTNLPEQLPNPVSDEPYAAKYFFLRYTLNLEESVVADMVQALKETVVTRGDGVRYVGEESELVTRPLMIWLSTSLLVRLVAEALGDLLSHVAESLLRHAQLALEESERNLTTERNRPPATDGEDVDIETYLDRLSLHRPRIVPSYQLIGRRRPKRVRVRLIPFEAFPEVTRCLPTPFANITRQVKHHQQHQREMVLQSEQAVTQYHQGLLQSPFTTVLMRSEELRRHLQRAVGALEWSENILKQARQLVDDLPPLPQVTEVAEEEDVPKVPMLFGLGSKAEETRGEVTDTSSSEHTTEYRRQLFSLCYTQSKIQGNVDSIFHHLQWNVLENDLLPALDVSKEGSNVTSKLEEGEEEGDKDEIGFTPVTEQEKAVRSVMRGLREAVESFQCTVADLLEVHEEYFANANVEEKSDEEPH